jgi:hypothetical protein
MPARTVTVSRIKTDSRAPTERRLHSDPSGSAPKCRAIPGDSHAHGSARRRHESLEFKGCRAPLPLDASCGSVFASYFCRARWCRP